MKKFLIPFTLLVLLLTGYFAYNNRAELQSLLFKKGGLFSTTEQWQTMKDEAFAEQLSQEQRSLLSFAGQHNPVYDVNWDTTNSAWLLKGKLLDDQYADIFAKIKDTIPLGFGAQFYSVSQTEMHYHADARFVFENKKDAYDLILKDTDDEYELKKIYAKLVYEGKAEGYRIVPQKFYSSKYLYSSVDFQDKYQRYFSQSFILEVADYEIKEVLLDNVFNTEEGKNFGYSNYDGDYREYSVVRDFTRSGRDELAIVLTDLKEAEMGRHRDMLIVIAYHPEKEQYYMLYKKIFYDKIKIGEYFYSSEKDQYHQFAQNNTGLVSCILLQVASEPERVLQYNEAFDQMDEVAMDKISSKIL